MIAVFSLVISALSITAGAAFAAGRFWQGWRLSRERMLRIEERVRGQERRFHEHRVRLAQGQYGDISSQEAGPAAQPYLHALQGEEELDTDQSGDDDPNTEDTGGT